MRFFYSRGHHFTRCFARPSVHPFVRPSVMLRLISVNSVNTRLWLLPPPPGLRRYCNPGLLVPCYDFLNIPNHLSFSCDNRKPAKCLPKRKKPRPTLWSPSRRRCCSSRLFFMVFSYRYAERLCPSVGPFICWSVNLFAHRSCSCLKHENAAVVLLCVWGGGMPLPNR